MSDDDKKKTKIKSLGLLKESSGKLSSTRFVFLAWAFGVLIVWVIKSINGEDLAKIDSSIMTILGLLMGGKVFQRFAESNDDE